VNLLRATALVALKDLRIELRTGEIVTTTTLFAGLVTILTSLSFYIDPPTARRIAPGVLWIAITFSGVLAMGRSWGREREQDVVRALLLSPAPRAAIYFGKAIGALAFLVVVEIVLVPVVALLFHIDMIPHLGMLATLLLLGTVGFVAVGTLFAAMGVRTRARDLVLSIVVFPLVVPALLAGVVATREMLGGASFSETADWLRILLAFDIVSVAGGATLFGILMSD
jgi:heme exporter protein B